MTAATYTFTLSAAQSSASSMVAAMRAKTGSSTPGTAARWAGNVMPQVTLNWPAGATTATATVNTAPNAAVDGNAEYEWYKVSSTPSDLTLTTASLPTVTITDDDSAPPAGNIFGPSNVVDSQLQNAGTTRQRLSYTYKPNVPGEYEMRMGADATEQNCFILKQVGSNSIALISRVAGAENSVSGVVYTHPGGFQDNDVISAEVLSDKSVRLSVAGAVVNGQSGYGVGQYIVGNYARIQNVGRNGVTPAALTAVTIATIS